MFGQGDRWMVGAAGQPLTSPPPSLLSLSSQISRQAEFTMDAKKDARGQAGRASRRDMWDMKKRKS